MKCYAIRPRPATASSRRSHSARLRPVNQRDLSALPGFLFLDPPDHTRLRRLVSKAFAPKVVKALEHDITALVNSLLDKVAGAGQFEVVADLAHPLPVAVICRLLGVPLQDEPEISHASDLLPRGWTRSSRSAARRPKNSTNACRPESGCANTSAKSSDDAAPTPVTI